MGIKGFINTKIKSPEKLYNQVKKWVLEHIDNGVYASQVETQFDIDRDLAVNLLQHMKDEGLIGVYGDVYIKEILSSEDYYNLEQKAKEYALAQEAGEMISVSDIDAALNTSYGLGYELKKRLKEIGVLNEWGEVKPIEPTPEVQDFTINTGEPTETHEESVSESESVEAETAETHEESTSESESVAEAETAETREESVSESESVAEAETAETHEESVSESESVVEAETHEESVSESESVDAPETSSAPSRVKSTSSAKMNNKVIVATVVLGMALLVGGVATGTYFIGKNAGKKAQLEAGTDTMKNTMDTVAQVQPAQPEAQAEDTVQMTPEQIKKEGMPINPGDNIAEKIGFKPKKQQKLVNVGEDASDATGYRAPLDNTPKKKVVKVYEIVESTNGGRTW